MSRIQTHLTNRIVKPFISPQALISSDNQSLSVVIFQVGWMSLKTSVSVVLPIIVIMIVTSKSRRPPQTLSSLNQRAYGEISTPKTAHKPTRKFL